MITVDFDDSCHELILSVCNVYLLPQPFLSQIEYGNNYGLDKADLQMSGVGHSLSSTLPVKTSESLLARNLVFFLPI